MYAVSFLKVECTLSETIVLTGEPPFSEVVSVKRRELFKGSITLSYRTSEADEKMTITLSNSHSGQRGGAQDFLNLQNRRFKTATWKRDGGDDFLNASNLVICFLSLKLRAQICAVNIKLLVEWKTVSNSPKTCA